MLRRLYFVLPDEEHAEAVVADLEQAGIARANLHALARPDHGLERLPRATPRQQHDALGRIERGIWIGLLALFAVALAGLALSLYAARPAGAAVAVAVIIASLAVGVRYALRVPEVHLDEFRGALAHGEIVLMVDVPPKRVAEVEARVGAHHPEAVAGGVGWTVARLGV